MRILPRFFIYANELLNYSILYRKLLSNVQFIDSSRELIAKFLAKIGELRKKFAEIKVNLRIRILRSLNLEGSLLRLRLRERQEKEITTEEFL